MTGEAWPADKQVFARKIQTSRGDWTCDRLACGGSIRVGQDYLLDELGWAKTPLWARRRRHLGCAPAFRADARKQLERDLDARRAAGDFDGYLGDRGLL
jgi:hypothetical protein